MTITLPSYAKINWTLEILGKRPDGYHELRTLLQTVSVADTLRFTKLEQGIKVHCDHPEVPTDERNLVHQAARLLNEYTGIERGVRIEIKKRIPTAAGLGGGSSNAAVTLLALRKLWEVEIPPRDLFALGSRLGADVPFFFMGGTCLGVGRGDEIYPVAEIASDFLLLVNAGILVPTREVYANLPPELTNPTGLVKMPLSLEVAYLHEAARERAQENLGNQLHNDLEIPVLPRYPRLREVQGELREYGARGTLLSGSGSTVFAIFDNDQARQEAVRELRASGWWCAPVRTLGRREYRASLADAGASLDA